MTLTLDHKKKQYVIPSKYRLGFWLLLFWSLYQSVPAVAISANSVWFEFHPGFYRVYIEYTLPELKQLRTAVAEFRSKRKAQEFYFGLLRGGEFELSTTNKTHVDYVPQKKAPNPW